MANVFRYMVFAHKGLDQPESDQTNVRVKFRIK